jgi:ABC-2 type transport system permease protein
MSEPARIRPLYWSVRRELWENKSVYIVPLIVSGVILFGFAISMIGMPHRRRAALLLDEAHQRAAIGGPYVMAGGMLLIVSAIVAAFYCLDALYGERRDRSILFWKSLPVSDRTTVTAKASIPLVIVPVIAFVVAIATQFAMFVMTCVLLLASGLPPEAAVWPQMKYALPPFVLAYGVVTMVLWHAPIYGWMMLVSGWAKRATLAWAFVPFLAVMMLEKIAFNTQYFAHLIGYRFAGWIYEAFVPQVHNAPPMDPIEAMTPLHFLATPGLWIGLVFAAVFFIAAARMRRNRAPI